MKLSFPCLIVGWVTCITAALTSAEKVSVPSAASVASGAADAAEMNKKSTDVEAQLTKKVGEMITESTEKVKSLKGMLTTNSKAIAALTGLFKELSKLTTEITQYETQLITCKKELAQVKSQQQAGPANDAFFNSASRDPLAGMSFFQMKAEAALAHASDAFVKIQNNQTGISLLQRRHRHRRRSHSEEEDGDDGAADSGSVADSASDSVSFGLSTIDAGEEDMESRTKNIARSNPALPGTDPLEYGMYDFTGSRGVKIFDHDSLSPDVQRQRELAKVNDLTRRHKVFDDDDVDDDDDEDD